MFRGTGSTPATSTLQLETLWSVTARATTSMGDRSKPAHVKQF